MADIARMQQALIAADAAGDTAAAQEIAKAIRAAQAAPASPAPKPAPYIPDYAAMFQPKSKLKELGGVLDAGLTGVANTIPSITGSIAAVVAPWLGGNSQEAEQKFGVAGWGARPMTAAGRYAEGQIGENFGKLFAPVVNTAKKADEVTGLPISDTARHMMTLAPLVPGARAMAPGVSALKQELGTATRNALQAGQRRFAPTTAPQTLARQVGAAGSQGAAAAVPDLTGTSPALQQAIVKTGRKADVNLDVLRRHQDAESLPVPIRLLEGEATGDVVQISRDRNMRGAVPDMARHMDATNKALGENMQVLRDRIGPDVFSANIVEHGDSLISAYRSVDESANAQIGAAYQALRDAAGGRFPIGAQTLLRNTEAALKKELKSHYAPSGEMGMLREWAEKPGTMTFEDFEALRTNLATIQRTSADGNARRAAGIIREQMEELPLTKGAEHLKGIADNARSLARKRFEALEADPAYKAAVEESVPPDRFVQKFVIGGTRDNIAKMARSIPEAQQTMSVSVLDYLRDQAKVGPGQNGNFAADSYSRALRRVDPSLRSMFTPDDIETLEKLERVSRYTTVQPRGSFVNNSNTGVMATATAGAGKILEGILNTGGTGFGTAAKEGIKRRSGMTEYRRISAPGAGLDYRKPPGLF